MMLNTNNQTKEIQKMMEIRTGLPGKMVYAHILFYHGLYCLQFNLDFLDESLHDFFLIYDNSRLTLKLF